MESIIHLKNISKEFNNKYVLHNINLEVNKGEIFGLLGPSGAGKTTLIKIITGQLKQNGGNAKLLGYDTSKLPQYVYTKIGMVLDELGIYERLSCYDNLKIFADIHNVSIENIDIALEKVKLTDAIKTTAGKLSKGMKQRLVLARAILTKPEVLFLDEPTSGLDPLTSMEIHNLILEQKKAGTAIFLTTHKMDEATKLCDKIALLYKGEIVEKGRPDEICRKYNDKNRIHIRLQTGEEMEIPNKAESAETIKKYFLENQIDTIHSTEPNLEAVFMQLTGKGLNYE